MSLLITIIKARDSLNITESSKTFDRQGGSIGRGKDNSWVLDDPERFLSSHHCQFSYEDGGYYITDLSTNGTFYNGSANPIGKGMKLPVNDGDTFVIGDYEFSVSLSDAVSLDDPFAASNDLTAPSPFTDELFSPSPAGTMGHDENDFSGNPFAGGHVSSSDSLFSSSLEETDPLAALDKAQSGSQQDPLAGVSGGFGQADPFNDPSYSDQADPLHQQVSWPDAVVEQAAYSGGIPDDWDDDSQSSASQASTPAIAPVQPSTPITDPAATPQPTPVVPQTAAQNQFAPQQTGQMDNNKSATLTVENNALKKANSILQSELKILKQQLAAKQQRNVKTDVSVDTTLIDAMGFDSQDLVDAEITQINTLVGEVVREMISGLMQVLGSRSAIKNEFRMNVTTIQPVENNPLKFSANVDDALENMFIKKGNAYKKPVEAVSEGFQGIAEHQVAILAGIRAAFKGVIQRFDPVLLDAKFSRQNKGGLIPGSQKAKNWELYLDYYNELVGDIDNTFQYIFGDDFVQAYEDQLQKLAIARKSKISKDDK